MLVWQLYRNLENSLKYFLDTEITAHSVTDINSNLIPVQVGRKTDNNWSLPCIIVYFESETNVRLECGSNLTEDQELMLINIYATNEGERLDLAKWVTDTIKNGWRYYSYTINPSLPETPTKTAGGLVSLDFVTNTRVTLGENVSPIDAHRHRISIRCWISGS